LLSSAQFDLLRLDAPLPLASYAKAEVAPIEHPALIEFRQRYPSRSLSAVSIIAAGGLLENARWETSHTGETLRYADFSVTFRPAGPPKDNALQPEVLASWNDGVLMLQGRSYSGHTITMNASSPIDCEIDWTDANHARILLEAKVPADLTFTGAKSLTSQLPLPKVIGPATSFHLPAGRTELTVATD
jgi:hypothetical protein